MWPLYEEGENYLHSKITFISTHKYKFDCGKSKKLVFFVNGNNWHFITCNYYV